jgi:hypothetical protein
MPLKLVGPTILQWRPTQRPAEDNRRFRKAVGWRFCRTAAKAKGLPPPEVSVEFRPRAIPGMPFSTKTEQKIDENA